MSLAGVGMTPVYFAALRDSRRHVQSGERAGFFSDALLDELLLQCGHSFEDGLEVYSSVDMIGEVVSLLRQRIDRMIFRSITASGWRTDGFAAAKMTARQAGG